MQESDMSNSNQQGGTPQQGGRDQGGSNRGFASMDDEQQRAIAAEGGREAHRQGVAHEFDSEEAREAGRKGGQSRGSNASDTDRIEASDSRGENRAQQTQGRDRDEQGQFTSDRGSSSSERSSRSDEDRQGGGSRGE
jgi:general stress protein YciG